MRTAAPRPQSSGPQSPGPRARRRTVRPSADEIREAAPYQAPLEALMAEPTPATLRRWPLFGLGLIAALLTVASVAQVDVVVTAAGKLTPDAPPVVLQPLSGAVLRELRVRPGDTVAAGDVVAVLDGAFTDADRDALLAQKRAMTAQRDRLLAELSEGPDAVVDPASADATAAGAMAAGDLDVALQALLREQRAAFRAARLEALDTDIRGLQAALEAERAAAAGIEEQAAVAREVERMRERLLEGQAGSRLQLLMARSERLGAEQAASRQAARIDEIAHQLRARRAEREAFVRDWERQALEELSRLRPDLARVEEQLAKAERLSQMTELRAPGPGVVIEVARRAPGSLVREGEPVVILSPTDAPLIAEVQIRSSDVGWLTPGAPTTLKIDAFPWRRFGALEGALRSVGRDSYGAQQTPQTPEAAGTHRAHILLTGDAMRDLPDGASPTAGMTLSAEIKVGQRSVIGYFMEPVLRGLSESLREP